jgi:TolA-binding protein
MKADRHILRAFFLAGVVALAVSLGGAGCAYYNTFYNAKRIYREAQETPRAKDGTVSRAVKDRYDEVITRCEMLIQAYPTSKHVDDAVLLIGKCLYEQEEYADALVKFAELQENFPDSKLNKEGNLYVAKCYIAKENDEQAIPVLEVVVGEKPKKASDEVLFLLGTALLRADRDDDAVRYLEILADKYPNSPYRVDADLEAATVYSARGEFEKSLAIYEKLRKVRLKEPDRIRFLSALAKLFVDMGQYENALVVFEELESFIVDPAIKAENLLVVGRAHAGMDSVSTAINTYSMITTSYPKSKFSAEAYFRLGELYQDRLDSLQVAQQQFDNVPRQYASSEFAEEAVSRSVSISKLLRLRASIESGEGENNAAVQFDLAEIQLFQLKDYQAALEGYNKVLNDFPDSDLAPKAAYAIAFIYDTYLEDTEKAREAYELLLSRYPASQQAGFASSALAEIQGQERQ